MAGGSKYAQKWTRAIAALLVEASQEEAARQAGIHPRTLRHWLQDEQFQAAYRQARQQAVDAAVSLLQGAATKAVETLRRNLAAPKAQDQIRAAVAILAHLLRAQEQLTTDERLRALEAELAQNTQPPGTPGAPGRGTASGS